VQPETGVRVVHHRVGYEMKFGYEIKNEMKFGVSRKRGGHLARLEEEVSVQQLTFKVNFRTNSSTYSLYK